MNDTKIIHKLYEIRGKGRNDWPCEAMWNSLVASFLFEHETVEGLLRELRRNKQLRALCGFEPKTVRQKDGTIKVYAISKCLLKISEKSETVSGRINGYVYGTGTLYVWTSGTLWGNTDG